MSNSGSVTKERNQLECSKIECFTISKPEQFFEFPPSLDVFRIQFNLHVLSQDVLFDEEYGVRSGVVNHKSEQVITFPRSSNHTYAMIVRVLRSMVIPEHEQPIIIAKIFGVVLTEQQSCKVSFNVDIYMKPKPIPATKIVEKLKKEKFERSSAICLEDFEAGLRTNRLRCAVQLYTKALRNLKLSAS